jgi:hypothetical protein
MTAEPTVAAPTATSSALPEPAGSEPAADAGAWTQLTDEPIPYLHDVTQGPTGFVGVGMASTSTDGSPIPAIWRSDDGITWTEEPTSCRPGSSPATCRNVAAASMYSAER